MYNIMKQQAGGRIVARIWVKEKAADKYGKTISTHYADMEELLKRVEELKSKNEIVEYKID